MELLNLHTHYTVDELSTLTTLDFTRFYSLKKELNLKTFIMPSGRKGYGTHLLDFENMLEQSKSFDFEIKEYRAYRERKRPIQQQFLTTNQTLSFLEELGDERTVFSIMARIRERKIPAYALKRKYLIPIVHLIRLYALPIDKHLDELLSTVTGDPQYRFRL